MWQNSDPRSRSSFNSFYPSSPLDSSFRSGNSFDDNKVNDPSSPTSPTNTSTFDRNNNGMLPISHGNQPTDVAAQAITHWPRNANMDMVNRQRIPNVFRTSSLAFPYASTRYVYAATTASSEISATDDTFLAAPATYVEVGAGGSPKTKASSEKILRSTI